MINKENILIKKKKEKKKDNHDNKLYTNQSVHALDLRVSFISFDMFW